MDLDHPAIVRGDLRHPLDALADSPHLMGDLLPAEEPSCDCIGLGVRLCCQDFSRRRDEDALPARADELAGKHVLPALARGQSDRDVNRNAYRIGRLADKRL
jgi:hypothetical protein